MTLLVTYVAVALGFSFLCSVLEAVLLSVTPSYVAQLQEERPGTGTSLAKLKADVDRPLAAILSLNTVANTFGAAGAGAEATRIFGSEWFGLASACLTLSILVISEIIPKTLGAVYWRRIAPFAAKVLPLLIAAMYPLVWISEGITRLLKQRSEGEAKVSKEEIAALAKLGEQQGILAESEGRILTNLFRFAKTVTRDIMTPRTVMFSLSSSVKVGDLVPRGSLTAGQISPLSMSGGLDDTAKKSTMIFSRIPIWGESPDDVVGYVLKDEIFLRAARDELDLPLSDLVRKFEVVPELLALPTLFERLVATREHIALVVDEYGGIAGVVTMEDVLETLMGVEIVDEADDAVDMREMARKKWREQRTRSMIPAGQAADPDDEAGE
ncbi:MAG: CNNM domain-containing protein [Myxococcota bacterium]